MLVLAIDTSTPTVTAGAVQLRRPHEMLAEVAGHEPEGNNRGRTFLAGVPYRTLAEHTVTDAFGHAEHLMPLAAAALAEAGYGLDQVEAVVVGIGPGPFTGLRVGMATAEALGDALDVPVHGVPSHDGMAHRAAWAGDFLVVTDARRREVYLSAYEESVVRQFGPVVVSPAGIGDLLIEHGLRPQWLTGAGAHLVTEVTGLEVREPPVPLSEHLVACAARGLLTGAVPGPLNPLYLRRPDAVEPGAPKPVLPLAEPQAGGR